MKKIHLFLFALLLATSLTACAGGGGGDQSTPEGTVTMIFDAAKSGNYAPLANICDPNGDGDTRDICNMANDDSRAEEFKEAFADGEVVGEARIEGDRAEVDFKFGPGGVENETMRLVKVDGKWLLSAF